MVTYPECDKTNEKDKVGYGVNIHDTNILYVQVEQVFISKSQWGLQQY